MITEVRKTFLCIISAYLLLSCQPGEKSEASSKEQNRFNQPNIIMIVVDDMRWDEYSAVGHPFLSTPNID